MPGLLERLGDFGRSIIQTIRQTGRSIAEAIQLAPKQAGDIEPSIVAQEFSQVARITDLGSQIADLPRTNPIPDFMHTTTDIPFKRPFAYTVTVSGRAVAGRIGPGGVPVGGRFTRDEFNITSNRQLTPEEVENIALRRFGAGGEYPLLSIQRISVTGAMTRE